VSSVAQEERWQVASPGWASRLIPGSEGARNRRKVPRAVESQGSLRPVARVEPPTSRKDAPHWLLELFLPHPVSIAGGWRLGLEVAADTAFILATWALLSGLAAGFPGGVMVRETTQLLPQVTRSLGFSLVFAALVTLLGYSEGLYQEGVSRSDANPTLTSAKSVAQASLITGVSSGLSGWELVPLPWFVAGVILNCIGLSGWRQWRIHQQMRRCGSRPLNVLIVGGGPAGRAVASYLERHPEHGRAVRGFLDDQKDFGVLGRVSDLARIARAEFADELVVTPAHPAGAHEPGFVEQVLAEARANHLDVRIVPQFVELGAEAEWIEKWGEIPVVALHREHLPHGKLVLKRGMDLAVATFALVLAAPFMAAIALMIALDSDGPALYAAERVGRKGRRFRCLKFRTMLREADAAKERLRAQNEREGPCFKIVRDPRITRLGRVLRRYSLDELPQLWNVVRGDMSLVGPRPHPVDDFARYELEHLRRLDVTPGITGLWQVTARQDPSFETNLALDLEYIEHWSPWLDVQILWRTVTVVLRGTGA
jgi:exopolysaccharide biosynthesis polyprenyl glycosylphosphotransferase